MNESIGKTKEQKIINVVFWLILLAGVAMRVHFHFMGRSLWEDEAHIALNFMHLDYVGLTQPLENYQTAPIFFLFSVEAISNFFGYSPVVLRSFPFLISILCYPLFYFFVRDLTKNKAVALISFLIFSFNATLIYYCSEVKSYTVDVSVYVLLGFLSFSIHPFVSRNRKSLLAIAGAVSIPYSNATPIVLVAAGLYLLLKKDKDSKRQYLLKYNWAVFLTWVVAFGVNYYFFLYNHPYAEGMKLIWKDSFAPIDIFSKEFNAFIAKRTEDILFSDMLYLKAESAFKYISILLLALGSLHLIIKKQVNVLLFTVVPIAIHFVLSMYKLYPFFYRFILYLLPCIIIILSTGITAIATYLDKMNKVLTGVFVFFCLYCSVSESIKRFTTMDEPFWHREIKPAINFINTGYPNTYVFITTPYTLYTYYLETGYAMNKIYGPIDWGITPAKYFEKVAARETNYLLLYSVDGYADGYGPIIKELERRHLIVNRMEHGTYGVIEVRPLHSSANVK